MRILLLLALTSISNFGFSGRGTLPLSMNGSTTDSGQPGSYRVFLSIINDEVPVERQFSCSDGNNVIDKSSVDGTVKLVAANNQISIFTLVGICISDNPSERAEVIAEQKLGGEVKRITLFGNVIDSDTRTLYSGRMSLRSTTNVQQFNFTLDHRK